MIRITKPDAPAVLLKEGREQRELMEAAYEAGGREFKFDSKLYGHPSVKQALAKAQHGKCAFCESHITHVDYGDIEHFRPKGGFQQHPADELEQPGYYWLAYEWGNLLLSCTLCNQRHKRNLFPLADPSRRMRSHHDAINNAEAPLFIHPGEEDPEALIGFRMEMPYAIGGNERARMTIEALGLDRPELALRRRKWLDVLKRLWEFARVAAGRPEDIELRKAAEDAREVLENAVASGSEYSAMVRAAIRGETP